MTFLKRCSLVAMLLATLASLVPTDILAQRSRGGSFGGSRGGGGGSFRSYRPSSPSRSFGSSRGSRPSSPYSGSYSRGSSSGSSYSSSRSAMPRYGTPLRQEARTLSNGAGGQTNYVFNTYGGFGDRFMMGYMLGSMPWYYHTPFFPAFYYARPYQVTNPDGTVSVYPGEFQWGTLFFMLLLIGGIIFILYVVIRSRRRGYGGRAAGFSDDWSQSSFS